MKAGTVSVKRRIPFKDLQSFPNLFATYCEDYSRLESYYAGDPFSDNDLLEAVERTSQHERDLETLVEVLLEQNSQWGLDDKTRSRIESLREGGVAVVTGQQLGVLGGPMYTQFKTITTIQLAAKLEAMTGRPVVPIFWLAGEDHDFDEVAHIHASPDTEVVLEGVSAGGPVGRIVLDRHMGDVIDAAETAYHGTSFGDVVTEKFRESFSEGRSWCDAFALYMKWLFADDGLIIVSGDDKRLKQLGAPLFAKTLDGYNELNASILATSEKLSEEFHAQLAPRSTNLFFMDRSRRIPIEPKQDGFDVGRDEEYSRGQLHKVVSETPEYISPNVVCRPLYQDHIIPTVAYVAGPGEISYFAQLKEAYRWAGIPMPIIYPRVSATILEKNISRLMDKEDIAIEDIETDVERMFTRIVKDTLSDNIATAFAHTRSNVESQIAGLAEQVGEVDPTLKKAALSIVSTLEKELGKLQGKVVRSEKQRLEVTRTRLLKIVESLFPGGVLQERSIAVSYFMSRYGVEIIRDLVNCLPVDTSQHVIINVEA